MQTGDTAQTEQEKNPGILISEPAQKREPNDTRHMELCPDPACTRVVAVHHAPCRHTIQRYRAEYFC